MNNNSVFESKFSEVLRLAIIFAVVVALASIASVILAISGTINAGTWFLIGVAVLATVALVIDQLYAKALIDKHTKG